MINKDEIKQEITELANDPSLLFIDALVDKIYLERCKMNTLESKFEVSEAKVKGYEFIFNGYDPVKSKQEPNNETKYKFFITGFAIGVILITIAYSIMIQSHI